MTKPSYFLIRKAMPSGYTCRWRCLLKAIPLIAISLCTAQASVIDEPVPDFGSNPGSLHMFLYRPAGFSAGMPLVVALHGCTQTAAEFGESTGLVTLAEETPFLLLLPEQRKVNMSRRCFRWYDSDDNRSGRGESASILEMIDFAIETQGADPDRVFILGLSAGGAMSAVMMANYPERFAGGAIFAGLPYGCNRARSLYDFSWNWLHYSPFSLDGADASYACGIVGFSRTDRTASDWARYVTRSSDSVPEQWPLVSLWQGTADSTVDPDNLRELTEQWTEVQGIDAIADDRQTDGNAVREVYRDNAGNARLETWTIEDFEHGVPIDADGNPDACGFDAPFILDARLCAVRRVADFWQLQ